MYFKSTKHTYIRHNLVFLHVNMGPFLAKMAIYSPEKVGCWKNCVGCILHRCWPYRCQPPSLQHRCQLLLTTSYFIHRRRQFVRQSHRSRGINPGFPRPEYFLGSSACGPASLSPQLFTYQVLLGWKKRKWHASAIIKEGERSGLFLSSYPWEFLYRVGQEPLSLLPQLQFWENENLTLLRVFWRNCIQVINLKHLPEDKSWRCQLGRKLTQLDDSSHITE